MHTFLKKTSSLSTVSPLTGPSAIRPETLVNAGALPFKQMVRGNKKKMQANTSGVHLRSAYSITDLPTVGRIILYLVIRKFDMLPRQLLTKRKNLRV